MATMYSTTRPLMLCHSGIKGGWSMASSYCALYCRPWPSRRIIDLGDLNFFWCSICSGCATFVIRQCLFHFLVAISASTLSISYIMFKIIYRMKVIELFSGAGVEQQRRGYGASRRSVSHQWCSMTDWRWPFSKKACVTATAQYLSRFLKRHSSGDA